MRAKAGILIIICLLFLVGTAGAAVGIPDKVVVTTDQPWIIANNVDQSNITVTVTNTTPPYNGNVQGVTVSLAVDPLYGTMSPTTVTTDSSGMASSTFKVKKKSGTANIIATVTGVLPFTLPQNIDHDSPYLPRFEYPSSGTVATEVPFSVSITDRWGNRIDDRKQTIASDVHTISLHVHGPSPDDCGFIGGTPYDIYKTLDAYGNTTVMVKLTSSYGPNSILMDAFGSIPDKLEWIVAETSGTPFTITQTYDPTGAPPQLPADGVQKFTIKYMIYDKFGNPTNTQPVNITTSVAGEEVTYVSNSVGQVWFTYGPKSFTGDYTITATAVNNNSVTISNFVRFYNTSANSFVVTASPQTMASHDANPSLTSSISAKVIDIMGNPVTGELVTFSLNSINVGTFNQTAPPTFITNSTVTDINGIATVQFIPGTFNTDKTVTTGYNSASTGTCTVTATWNGIPKNIGLVWKNYPYLSAVTKVSPSTVKLNHTVDITLTLNGDGWALKSNPIDVVLVMDRSGSMGGTDVAPSRLGAAQTAANTFISKMDTGNDRVGLVSYSYAYDVTHNAHLQRPFGPVTTAVTALSSGGATGTRRALYEAINELKAYPNPDNKAVRAVILMTDGDFNNDGTPLGIGNGFPISDTDIWTNNIATWSGSYPDFTTYNYYTGLGGGTHYNNGVNIPRGDYGGIPAYYWGTAEYYSNAELSKQNMAVYAQEETPKIRIYTISFAGTLNPNSVDVLKNLATSTGGFYEHAPNAAKLSEIYTRIAGDLRTEAGVNTTAVMDFGTITINNVSDTSGQVFEYVPDTIPTHAPGSTFITLFNKTHTLSSGILDQSPEWIADKKLTFNIGTVHLNETWETTFRLKVLKEGNINVFGNNSIIQFEDSQNTGINSLFIPPAFITSSQNLTMTGMTMKTVTLTNLRCTEAGEIKALLPVAWATSYTGINVVREQVYYSINNGPYVRFAEITGILPGTSSQQAQLDVTRLPPGGYQIKVVATAPDTPDAYALLPNPITVGGRGITFIKIE